MKNIPLKRILSYVKPHVGLLVVGLICSLLYAVAALLIPVFVGKAVS